MWDALKFRNNLTKTITKKLAIVLFAVAITLVTVGCAPKPVEAIESPTTANTPVSPEAKPAPSPPIETKSPRELELEALLEKAPEIEGLTKFIEDDKIIYKNSEGVKSGYYVEKAYYNGEETDGVSLSATVVNSIVEGNFAQGKEGYVPIPVDPSEGQTVNVDYLQSIPVFDKVVNYGVISVTTNKPINLTNFYPGNREIIEFRYSRKTDTNLPALKTEEGLHNTLQEGDYLGNMGIFLEEGNFYRSPTNPTFTSTCGDILGQIDQTIFLVRDTYDYTKKVESL
ncbi:hypothetical protein SDC9_71871 [bioreactor metagenome]|uniref:Uncharacterized protein n=1 Tax=bioreactor metagenome TaxID=1076179 RepID=A0A644YA66_9ZZZZ